MTTTDALSTHTIPDHYEHLPHQQLVELVKMVVESNKALAFTVEKLKYELDHYKRLVHGSKHERFTSSTSPDQLSLGLAVEPTHNVSIESTQKIEAHTRMKTKVERKPPTGNFCQLIFCVNGWLSNPIST